MSFEKWLLDKRLQRHKTSPHEIINLFRVVARDLSDAALPQLSVDRRFATAYNAALQLATIVLHVTGYRVRASAGHHWMTFAALPKCIGFHLVKSSDFFNACRMKRNMTDYDCAGSISLLELEELLKEVFFFQEEVLEWLKTMNLSWESELSDSIALLRGAKVFVT